MAQIAVPDGARVRGHHTVCPKSYANGETRQPGSDEGAENRGCLAALIETCKLNKVNPETYLTNLLTRPVNGGPQNRIDELMPWHWAT